MRAGQLFILKKETVGAERPYLIKLDRETSRLEVFKKCPNEKLYDYFPIRPAYDSSNYVIFQKELSVPCIFGGERSPTPTGLFYIEAKSAEEYISSFYPGYDQVKFFGYLMIFEDYFIHSDLYAGDEPGPTVGKAISQNDKTTSGCIRISQENLSWLMKHIDVGTLVFL